MPDSSITLELCDALNITVYGLFSGEIVKMDNYNKEIENNLLRVKKSSPEILGFQDFLVEISGIEPLTS